MKLSNIRLSLEKTQELLEIKQLFHTVVMQYEAIEIQSLCNWLNDTNGTATRTEFDYRISSLVAELEENRVRFLRVRIGFNSIFHTGDTQYNKNLYEVIYHTDSQEFYIRYTESWHYEGDEPLEREAKYISIETLKEKLGVN